MSTLAGCCGLAGNFGMERGHYEMSVAVAETGLLPALRARPEGAVVLADGFSCRTQIDQLAGLPSRDPGPAARRPALPAPGPARPAPGSADQTRVPTPIARLLQPKAGATKFRRGGPAADSARL